MVKFVGFRSVQLKLFLFPMTCKPYCFFFLPYCYLLLFSLVSLGSFVSFCPTLLLFVNLSRILFHLDLLRCVSVCLKLFRSTSFCFVLPQDISFYFILFRFVSSRFVLLHSVSFYQCFVVSLRISTHSSITYYYHCSVPFYLIRYQFLIFCFVLFCFVLYRSVSFSKFFIMTRPDMICPDVKYPLSLSTKICTKF